MQRLAQLPAVTIYSDVGLTRMCARAFPSGVQLCPSFTVASSKVTLSRCGWTMFTSSWRCEPNVFNLWIKSLFFKLFCYVQNTDTDTVTDSFQSIYNLNFILTGPLGFCLYYGDHCKQFLKLCRM